MSPLTLAAASEVYVWLPLSALTCLWFVIKCLTTSGYSLESEDD